MTLDDEAMLRFPTWSDAMRKRWVQARLAAQTVAPRYAKIAAHQPPPQQFFPRSMREAAQ